MKKITRTLINRERFYCDLCNKELIDTRDIFGNVIKCGICGIDLCEDCTICQKDYSVNYVYDMCKRCWHIGQKHREKIDKYKLIIADEYDLWQENCIKTCNLELNK